MLDVQTPRLCSRSLPSPKGACLYASVESERGCNISGLAEYKPGIRKSDVEKIMMPLPPLSFQQDIVLRLDALTSQVESLQKLGEQAEDNARFMLKSYLSV